jgi:transposase
MAVTIGIDPHKGSHTAVALDECERSLGQLRVRSGPEQLSRLTEWAKAWPERTWAVENASELGYLLSQQLVGAGERVVDVPPELAARARLLDNGDVNKSDPNDARSVAVGALRARRLSEVTKEDHAAVMRLWARRRKDLTSARTRVANRLHAVILELVPGGYKGEIYASKVERLLEAFEPAGAVAAARKELAAELLGDLRQLDGQLAELNERLAAVVAASGTTTTKIFGVGPVVAAITVGLTRDVGRFPDKDHFAAYNGSAPIEVSSGEKNIYRLSMRGSRQLNHALHMTAVSQVRDRHSEGRAYYDKKVAQGKTGKEALRALKRRISDALYAAMVGDARSEGQDEHVSGGPGGQTGNGSVACAAGSHPAKPALRPSHSRAKPKARPSRQAARSLRLRESQNKISKAS